MGDVSNSKAREKHLYVDSRPQFFKILLFPTDLQQLPIPRKFARELKRELSDAALLKGPSDIVWRVGLKEAEDGVVYFSDGWNKVTEHYSLNIGHFLVFRYEGNSQFNVNVFDETSCEKEYPYASRDDGEQSCSKNRPCAPEKEEEIDTYVETLGVSDVKDGDLLPKSRVLRSSARLRRYNQSNAMEIKSRERHTIGDLGDGNSQFNVNVFDETSCEKEYTYASGNDGEQSCSKNRSCSPEKEEEIDGSVEILGVSDVKDGVLLPKSRVSRSSARLRQYNQSNAMDIRSRERKTSGDLGDSVKRCSESEKAVENQNFEQAAKPQDQRLRRSARIKCIQSDGKKSCVSNCSSEKTTSVSTPMDSENKTEICTPSVTLEGQETELHSNSSTSKPSEDEKLKENESVARANRRVCQRFESERRGATTSKKEMALQKARKFNSNNPFFLKVMRPSSVYTMNVPLGFVKDHLPSRPQSITLQFSDGRHWPAGLLYNERSVLLSKGWSQFASENKLVGGDVCIFELFQTDKVRFNVTVYRAL